MNKKLVLATVATVATIAAVATAQGVKADGIMRKEAMESFKLLNANISEFQLSQELASKEMCQHNLVHAVAYLKSISKTLNYDFTDCFELAYNEIKDRKGKWIDGSFVKEEDLKNE